MNNGDDRGSFESRVSALSRMLMGGWRWGWIGVICGFRAKQLENINQKCLKVYKK